MNKLTILPRNLNNKDTFAYNEWAMHDGKFFHIDDANEVLGIDMRQQILDSPSTYVTGSGDLTESAHVQCRDVVNELAQFAYNYCSNVENDPEMRRHILDSGNNYLMCDYCSNVENDPEMRQAILDSGNHFSAYKYCRYVDNDPEMRQVIIDSGCRQAAKWYCEDVANDAEMRIIAEK